MTQNDKGKSKDFWIPDQVGNDVGGGGDTGQVLIKAGMATLHDGMEKKRVKENPKHTFLHPLVN
jgi:hypothetical protein